LNPYEVLQVAPHASALDIRNAYRKLVKEFHPDRNKNPDAVEQIKMINEAYAILSDPQRRARYDNMGIVRFPEVVAKENPREVYKREFLRKKKAQKMQEEKALHDMRVRLYAWVWKVCIFLAGFGLIIIADGFLPRITYSEKVDSGFQKHYSGRSGSGGYMVSYIMTENYRLSVPDDVHIYYDYYADNEPILVNVTPVFRVPVELGLFHRGEFRYFPVKGNVHYIWPIKYLLLISSLIILSSKTYSGFRYQIAFFPFLFFVMILFMLF
jgi:curved DNA-binding protein CbpA